MILKACAFCVVAPVMLHDLGHVQGAHERSETRRFCPDASKIARWPDIQGTRGGHLGDIAGTRAAGRIGPAETSRGRLVIEEAVGDRVPTRRIGRGASQVNERGVGAERLPLNEGDAHATRARRAPEQTSPLMSAHRTSRERGMPKLFEQVVGIVTAYVAVHRLDCSAQRGAVGSAWGRQLGRGSTGLAIKCPASTRSGLSHRLAPYCGARYRHCGAVLRGRANGPYPR